MKLLFLQESPMYEALGIHVLAGVAQSVGWECDLLVESEENDFVEKIIDLKPDLLAFSFMTRQQEWAIHTINKIRRVVNVPILIGGTHPTMYPETLGHCDADYLCVGEGEGPLADLLTRLAAGGRTDDIPNIHAKVDDALIANPIRTLIDKWDDLPLPDRDIYRRYPFLQDLPLKRFSTSFGCAFKCSFCYINNYRKVYENKGNFFRRKSIDRAIREIAMVKERYSLKRIHYVDDIFSLDKKWVKEFLPIFKEKIGIPWSANIWISHMTEDMVRLFQETGCVGLTFGVESGNEKTRRELIDKNIKDETYLKHCGYLRQYGIAFHTGNIIGLPGEGLDEAFETARFNRKIGATSARSGVFVPFPGTQLATYAAEYGLMSPDFSVELINQGIYPEIQHPQSKELVILANLFQWVAKWAWFDRLAYFMLQWPNSLAVKGMAWLVDQYFWFSEARFFGLLNWSGIKYYWYLRSSMNNMRKAATAPNPRFQYDAEAQRPFWKVSQADVGRFYKEPSRDGLT